jgi:hypothetical protein
MINLIRPPLYKNTEKPSERTEIADEAKKPSNKSNWVELHNPSEKKPTGFQSESEA